MKRTEESGGEIARTAEYALCGRVLLGEWEAVVAAGVSNAEQFVLPETRAVWKVAQEHKGDAGAVYEAMDGQTLDGRPANKVLREMEDEGVSGTLTDSYAKILLDAWRKRGRVRSYEELAKAVESDDDKAVSYWSGKLAEYETDAGGGGLALVSDADLHALDVPPPVPVVEGLLDVGEVGLLTAPAKAGKSWFLLQMAKCVAAGIPFLGKATRQGAVCYINAEVGADAWKRRSDAVTDALGIQPPPVYHASTRGQRNVTLLTLPVVLRKALKAVGVERVALVIVDPFYALVDEKMDENNASDVKAVMFEFQRLAVELGAAVVVCHHTGKGDAGAKSAGDRARGSSAFAGSPDAFFTLTPTGTPEENLWKLDGRRRNGIGPEPRTLQFEFPLWRDIGPASGDIGPTSAKRYTLADLQGAFTAGGEVLTVAEMVRRTGMGKSRVYELLKEAQTKPRPPIVREGDGFRLYNGAQDDF